MAVRRMVVRRVAVRRVVVRRMAVRRVVVRLVVAIDWSTRPVDLTGTGGDWGGLDAKPRTTDFCTPVDARMGSRPR